SLLLQSSSSYSMRRRIAILHYSLSLPDALPISSGASTRNSCSRCDLRPVRQGRRTRPVRAARSVRLGRGRLLERQRLAQGAGARSEEHTSELQSRFDLVCRLLLETIKYINLSTH